ncbi:signal protein [Yinghuangia seranimata]|uniref:signal protein n=1 Tax=Yinghuangia seranimata TaxID=408067 RepID=UPI00248B0208|nr:signal protein [Yinghuangia seranimata]MDI2127429.1 signal protein [Yinghuangia seranimata]
MIKRFGSVVGPLVACGLLVAACDSGSGDKAPAASGSAPASATAEQPLPGAAAGPDVAKLQERWWTWAAGQPRATNPVADTTGARCATGQPGDVWFVAGTFGGEVTRSCTVPAGRPIAGPLLNMHTDDPAQCQEFVAAADGEVVLDGKPADVKKLGPETVTLQGVAGNPVTGDAAPVTEQACGLWFSLAPLSPGAHKLTISGVTGSFKLNVTYNLTVG